MENTLEMSLGRFRADISKMTSPRLTRDNPLEPLSISMPVDSIHVVLGASPYIALHSGPASVTLSHIKTVKKSIKDGRKSYRIICGDYTASDIPQLVEYRIFCGKLEGETV